MHYKLKGNQQNDISVIVIFPWRRVHVCHHYEQSLPKNPTLITVGNGVVHEKIFNDTIAFSLFCNCVLLERGTALHLNKLKTPPSKDAFSKSLLRVAKFWLKFGSWEEDFKTLNLCKVYRDKQQVIRKTNLSIQLRWPWKNLQTPCSYCPWKFNIKLKAILTTFTSYLHTWNQNIYIDPWHQGQSSK